MHDETHEPEVDIDEYLKQAPSGVNRENRWVMVLVAVLVIIVVCGLFLGWRGIGYVLILGIAATLLILERSKTPVFAMVVLLVAAVLLVVYTLLAYQSM
jgi:hypothetical protein